MPQVIIKLPDVGEGTAQAEIAAWHVKVGDAVTEDQNLADITTDKATVEIPSPVSGKVVSLQGAPGDMIAVGSPLIVLEADGPIRQVAGTVEAKAEQASLVTATAPDAPVSPQADKTKKISAAPAVRQRAAELKIDLTKVAGSGPQGRIVHKDLDALLTQRQPEPASQVAVREGGVEVKIIGVRRKIAERMLESKRNIPHYTYVEEVDVTALEEIREELNAAHGATRVKLTILPFIMTAMVRAGADFPQINAHFDDAAGILRQYQGMHIGIATQTDKGLLVPVVFNAESKDLWSLAADVGRVAEAARTSSAARQDLTGSTITITSLGRLGGIAATPVINRPEVAIIGVNKIAQRPVVRDGQIVIRSMMNLSSSFDHRIVDGLVGASFIQRIKALLEQPALLLEK